MIDGQIVGQDGKPIAIADAVTSSWHVGGQMLGGMAAVRQIGGRKIPEPPPMFEDEPRSGTGNTPMALRTCRGCGQRGHRIDSAMCPRNAASAPPPSEPEPPAQATTVRSARHCTACGAAGHYAGGSKCPKSPTYNPRTLTMNQRLNNQAIERRLQEGAEVRAARERDEERELEAVSTPTEYTSPERAIEMVAAAVEAAGPEPVMAQQCLLCGRSREQSRAFVRGVNGNAVCTTCVLESLRLFVDAQITSERPLLTLTLEK